MGISHSPLHWSLGYFRQHGYGVLAFCQAGGPPPRCTHSAQLDIDQLIETFGEGFIIPNDRALFLSKLSCSNCGSKSIGIQITLPREVSGYRG